MINISLLSQQSKLVTLKGLLTMSIKEHFKWLILSITSVIVLTNILNSIELKIDEERTVTEDVLGTQ